MSASSDMLFQIFKKAGCLHALPKRPSEEMPDGLVAGRGVGEDDVLHLGVALKHADCAFEEGLAEGGEHYV